MEIKQETRHKISEKVYGVFKTYPKTATSVLIGVVFLAGFLIGEKASKTSSYQLENENSQLRNKGDFQFINPLLECEIFKKSGSVKYVNLENKIQEISEKMTDDSQSQHISIYFRDMNNGPWFGLNEEERFTPASLLKVPIMIAYFKKTEGDLDFLNHKVVFRSSGGNMGFMQNIKPKVHLEDNKEYTIDQIIENMIKYSDNDATNFLIENIDENYLRKIYEDLGIKNPSPDKTEDFMTVKEYAAFFRILYNASYLNKEMSEKALNLLSEIDFKDGLMAGISNDITISHKFGERKNGNSLQLHDCGIIYYPGRPYLLCVMARGYDFKKIEQNIAAISRTVFEEVKKQK